MALIMLLFLLPPAFAFTEVDARLAGYIRDFNLSLVKPPPVKRQKLFEIGRSLFSEKELAGNRNIRCIDCHHPRLNTQEGISLSLGEGATGLELGLGHRFQGTGRVLPRNTPALFNLHFVDVLFWDGRVSYDPHLKSFSTPVPFRPDVARTLKSALAAQALFPLVDHDEMRGLPGTNPVADAKDENEAWDIIVERIMGTIGYQEAFAEVYPGETINIGHIGEALAEFEAQSFYFADTPYDRYILGDVEALTPQQKLGMDVFFNKGNCGQCHAGEHLSTFEFHNVGVPQIGPGKEKGDDFGRYQWDKREGLKYAFRVPPLRNLGITAPYFHDGAFKTLEEVVDHYDDILRSLKSYRVMELIQDQLDHYRRPLKDHNQGTNEDRMEHLSLMVEPVRHFTPKEKSALVDFLKNALTDDALSK